MYLLGLGELREIKISFSRKNPLETQSLARVEVLFHGVLTLSSLLLCHSLGLDLMLTVQSGG